MKISQEIGVSFYQNLGKLLYAIAASDKQIHKKEIAAFKEILNLELQKKLPSEYALYALYQAQTSFDYYSSISADANECFEAFLAYKRTNDEVFTEEVKSLVKNTAQSIASAFSNKNKSELIMLAKLELELKKEY